MFQLQVERYDREHLSLSDPGIRLYDKQVRLEHTIYDTE